MIDLTQWPHNGLPPPAKPLVYTEAEENDRKAAEVRAERNAKLTATDWTQVADAPVDKSAWATYRQALREVPTQAGFPNTIVWPTDP
jgi:hypothetical protein